MHYKNWSEDIWSKEGILILKEVPVDVPKVVEPSVEKIDVQRLKQDISKWRQWLNEESWNEWDHFVNEYLPNLESASISQPTQWHLDKLLNEDTDLDSATNTLTTDRILQDERQQCTVFVGRRPQISEVEISNVETGDFVAVYCENYEKEPSIALCTKINEENIDIVWYEGTYSTAWKPWKIRDPNNRRKVIDWADNVPKESIILFAFKLTNRKHLKKSTIERLKEEYSKLKL
jgi:hypothetical protein